MGKLEKLVVLAVLFTAALVLALAFNRGGDEVEASDPLSGARRVLDLGTDVGGAAGLQGSESTAQPGETAGTLEDTPSRATHSAGPSEGAENTAEQAPSLLLNAGAESAPAFDAAWPASAAESTLTLQPQSEQTKRILMDTQGLRPSFLEDYRMYTLVEGDTWSGLAQRFYQDGRYTRNLHLANEDLEQLTPGKDILVPVFDFVAVDAGLQSGAEAPIALADSDAAGDGAREASAAEPVAPMPASLGTRPAASSTRAAKPIEYEVRSGDTLSDISLAVFGTATRWKEILELNRDKLQRPESLQVGMKLKIAAGGKLPAQAKKPEAKPKTTERAAESDRTAATTKKKKVL